MAGKKKNYTEDFKKQIVALKQSGKSTSEIANDYNNTGSFKASDNRTDEENELIRLRKENKQLLMENDILKQAALIMGRK